MDQPSTDQRDIIEQAGLLSALKALFERDDVSIVEWEQSSPGTPGTTAALVSRLQGVARVQGQTHPWSLIRKTLLSPEQRQVDPAHRTETPSGINYWKREFYAYQSDLLSDLPSGFTRPRCFHAQEAQDECTLWLEVLHDEIEQWPLARYGVAARHLGLFSGGTKSTLSLADYPWLSVEIARQRERNNDETFARFDNLRQHPLVRRGWPDDVAQGIIKIWEEREEFYRVLHELPQVIQHGDAGRRNLMALVGKEDEPITGAIDWGYVGVGAIGEEIAATVVSPVIWFQGITPEQMLALETVVLDNYLDGLNQAGWDGDPELVRLGYLCSVALRYGPNIFFPDIAAIDPKVADAMQKRYGWSLDEQADRLALVRRFVIQRADQARQLMAYYPTGVRRFL